MRKNPTFALTRYSLLGHPRFKRGTGHSGYLWWSKPIIQIHEVKFCRSDKPVEFNGNEVLICGYSKKEVSLKFTKPDVKKGEEKTRTILLNTPIQTGHDNTLCDASSVSCFACWTSVIRWIGYYNRIKLERWKDDWRQDLIDFPTYFTTRSIKHFCRYWYCRFKMIFEDIFPMGHIVFSSRK